MFAAFPSAQGKAVSLPRTGRTGEATAMIKLGSAYLFRLMVKLAKNAAIRGANDAAGKPLPSVLLDGVIGVTDDAVDGVWKWYIAARTPEQRKQDAEDLANLTPNEVEEAIATATAEEELGQLPNLQANALSIATAARRTLHERLTIVDRTGRSVLKPGITLESKADLAALFATGATRLLNPGDHVGGRYRIERFLAQGGMGEVYLATQTKMQRAVVLKTILPAIAAKRDFRERFFQEAQLAAKLSHPNIVPVYDADEDAARDLCFLTMQHLGGEPLDRWLKRRPTGVSLAEFGKLSSALCAALAHAHARGVVHFDLKPANVMVTDDLAEIFVVDFGLAKACGELAPGAAAMVTSIGGTPYYMAPEVLRSQKADTRADVYSLAVIFYELLTGEQPVAGCDPVSHLRPDVPAPISDAIQRAMRGRADDRTPSVDDLRTALTTAPAQPRTSIQIQHNPHNWSQGLGLSPSKLQEWDKFLFGDSEDDWVHLTGERLQRDADGFARARHLVQLWKAGGGGMNVAKLLIAAGVARTAKRTAPRKTSTQPAITQVPLRGQQELIERAVRQMLGLSTHHAADPAELARVTTLNLSGDAITDAGVAWLSDPSNGLTALTSLYLSGTPVTDAGVKTLARPDTSLKALTSLYLGGTRITDASLAELANPRTGLKHLAALSLGSTLITDSGVQSLASPTGGLNKLTFLNLKRTTVTDAGLKAARTRWPGIEILH